MWLSRSMKTPAQSTKLLGMRLFASGLLFVPMMKIKPFSWMLEICAFKIWQFHWRSSTVAFAVIVLPFVNHKLTFFLGLVLHFHYFISSSISCISAIVIRWHHLCIAIGLSPGTTIGTPLEVFFFDEGKIV